MMPVTPEALMDVLTRIAHSLTELLAAVESGDPKAYVEKYGTDAEVQEVWDWIQEYEDELEEG